MNEIINDGELKKEADNEITTAPESQSSGTAEVVISSDRIAPVNLPMGNVELLLKDMAYRGIDFKYILDVGANLGEWTRMARSIFPGSTIYMIEPLTEMESNLKKICEEFPNTKYFQNGAGSKIEQHVLTTWGDDLAGANCLVPENSYIKSLNKQRMIQIITIDSLIESGEIEIPDLAKLDIQGFEIEALKGATKLFGKTEAFILETSLFEFTPGTPLLSEVVIFMAERGYEIYDFPGFLRRPFDGALGQMDVCFARKNGILRASNDWIKTENPSAPAGS